MAREKSGMLRDGEDAVIPPEGAIISRELGGRDGARLFLQAQGERRMAGGDAPLGKTLCGGGDHPRDGGWSGGGISILRDAQSSPGEGPELPDVLGGWLCVEPRLAPDDLQGPFQPQLTCD